MESATADVSDINLGLYDGEVSHDRINAAVARGHKSILFGEQTRLPYFPDDERLFKLPANDPLVLLFWKVLHKVPENLRIALIDAPLSLTLVRDDTLLHFENYRCHQALHIGCRRRTLYLPEILLHAAEDRGYDYWAIAEGVIYAGWMLLDYLLLVDVLAEYAEQVRRLSGYRLGEALQTRLVEDHNGHRRDHVNAGRSEVVEFLAGYKTKLLGVAPERAVAEDPFALARSLFDPALEQRVYEIGTPAFTALHNVFDQIPERDLKRREILKQARILWSRLLARARSKAKARR